MHVDPQFRVFAGRFRCECDYSNRGHPGFGLLQHHAGQAILGAEVVEGIRGFLWNMFGKAFIARIHPIFLHQREYLRLVNTFDVEFHCQHLGCGKC